MLDKLNHRLANGRLPYGPRVIFIAIAILNLPGLILACIFFWTLLPLPAIAIYVFVIGFAFDRFSIESAKAICSVAIMYHLFLLMFLWDHFGNTGGLGTDDKLWARLGMITYVAGPMCLYALNWRMLYNSNNTSDHV